MIIKVAFALAFLCLELCAQGSSSGMGPLKLPLLARAASLGEATVADIFPGSYPSNPALLAESNSLEFSLSHEDWIESIRSEFLASTFPTSFGAAAFSVSSTSIPGIELRDIPGPPLGEFTARSAVFTGTAAFRLNDELSAGLSLKYLYEKIFIDDTNGYGLDVGVAYRLPIPGLKAGISLLHAGSMNRLREDRADLPTSLLVGGSYTIPYDDFDLLLLATQSFSLPEHTNWLRAGIETSYLNLFSARIGYQSGFVSRQFSYGFGIHYGHVLFDYGYVPFALALGNAHLITLGFAF